MDNKQSAIEFLEMIIAGAIDQAYEKHVNMSGKHHNTATPKGFASLLEGMKDADIKFPNKQLTIQHVMADQDLVAVHSHLVLEQNKLDFTTVHLFRFAAGKIVEMWDVSQPISVESPNQDGAF